MRIDRLLCNLRFMRTRTLAARLVREGHLRRNGVRVMRPSQDVMVGDVLTLALGPAVRLVEVLALPQRRGPASEARDCYRMLDHGDQTDIGAAEQSGPEGLARP
ncbi:MAG: RNA-binding S4 domain-containing protein [Qipengyuania sp.]|nr:RNA-binding S4 domain-containing protein [Qipengyuania sp.]